MPDNAILSGHVDFVMSPEKIAAELETLVKLPYTTLSSPEDISTQDQELQKIQALLYQGWNVDFSSYKQTTITRRILRRMALNKVKSLREYADTLVKKPDEAVQLYKDLLINVTSFFRDPALFDQLSTIIFPALLDHKKPSEIIRIWVPACSSGEEVYSIAICLFEYFSQHSIVTPVQLFGTDLSEGAIEKARAGVYGGTSMEKISGERRNRFFTKIDGHYQITKPIRDICVFATHNLLKDPPFSKLDLISCQNVFIYIEPEAQKRILQSFHYALKPTGYLLLGKSETIGKASELFSPASKDLKLFTKNASANYHYDFSTRNALGIKTGGGEIEKKTVSQPPDAETDREAEKILLSRFVPASVTINKDLQVLQFYGSTLNYLHPAAGKASLHLLKLVREELIVDVRTLVHQAKKEGMAAKKHGILLSDGGYKREISIEVIPIRPVSANPGYLILFRESGPDMESRMAGPTPDEATGEKDTLNSRFKKMEQEIRVSREQVRIITEEAEASREELQSANEEILSSNEELQSINEELETSKEELQSSNEELTTINEELLNRNNELRDAVEYSDAIIQTMTEPLVVLNADLRIRKANKAFYTMFRLQPEGTEGTYFYECGQGRMNIPELRHMLDNINYSNKTVDSIELSISLPGPDEKILLVNAMRMGPDNNKSRRYLLAIQDVTERAHNLKELNYRKEYFRLLVQNAFDIITIFSPDGTIKYQSESVRRILGYEPEDRVNKNIFRDPIVHPDDLLKKKEFFRRSIANPNQPVSEEFRLLHKDGSYRLIEAVCINLLGNPYIDGLVANYRDITRQKALERQKEEFIAVASHELKTPVTSIKGYAQIIQSYFQDTAQMEVSGLVDKLNNQVGRLTRLLENLLDVTRISAGQLELQPTKFDMNRLIEEIADEIRQTTTRQILTELQPCPQLTADRERIGQVITNLLSNAVKYSPHADKVIVRALFELSNAAWGPAISVSVQDFGAGISEKNMANIFERFFRVKDADTNFIPGLGLGLYISHQIIARHNGKLRVESALGKGSTFTFTLPVPYQ
jgi:two-component system CheB/CheR fusion protein